jgi:hypothetical protein
LTQGRRACAASAVGEFAYTLKIMPGCACSLLLCAAKNETSFDIICYALLRVRPLSISCAEGCVVISCGKVDYDKSGWRDD